MHTKMNLLDAYDNEFVRCIR